MRRTILAILLSSITLTAAAAPVPQLNDAPASTSRLISTGVSSPRLVHMTDVNIPADVLPTAAGSVTKVVLKLDLDASGSPTTVRVIHPVNPEVDARVMEAVRQFRWIPAMLNNKPVATDLTLTVDVQR